MKSRDNWFNQVNLRLLKSRAAFGKNIIAGDGQLNREELAHIIFADAPRPQKT
ncbi:MAG: hypothetical protein WDM76_10665 [Limisphaerales bacterium]